MSDAPTPPDELGGPDGFLTGLDSGPFLTQDAGDSSLIRQGGVMRIIASGSSLAEAWDDFLAIDAAVIHKGSECLDADGDRTQGFTQEDCGFRSLIGTSPDTMSGHRALVLLYRLNTLAHAAGRCAAETLTERLAGFCQRLSSSVQPGARLAVKVCERFHRKAERSEFVIPHISL